MIKKVLMGLVAASAVAVAVGIALVAAAFALYATLTPELGEAGAAAVVAGVAALIVMAAGIFAGMKAKGGGGHHRAPDPEPSLMGHVGQIAREKPMVAAGLALVAGLVALKNPKLAAGLASAFLAGKAADKASEPPRRRGW